MELRTEQASAPRFLYKFSFVRMKPANYAALWIDLNDGNPHARQTLQHDGGLADATSPELHLDEARGVAEASGAILAAAAGLSSRAKLVLCR